MITLHRVVENLASFKERQDLQSTDLAFAVRDPEPAPAAAPAKGVQPTVSMQRQEQRLWSRSVLCAAFNAVPFIPDGDQASSALQERVTIRCGPMCQQEALKLEGCAERRVDPDGSQSAVIDISKAVVPTTLLDRLRACHSVDCPFHKAESLFLPHYAGLGSVWEDHGPGQSNAVLCWLAPLGQVSLYKASSIFKGLRPTVAKAHQQWKAAAAAVAEAVKEGGEEKTEGDEPTKGAQPAATPNQSAATLVALKNPALQIQLQRFVKLVHSCPFSFAQTTASLGGVDEKKDETVEEDDQLTALALFCGWMSPSAGNQQKVFCHFCREETTFADSTSSGGIFCDRVVDGHRWFCPCYHKSESVTILSGNLRSYLNRLEQLSTERPEDLHSRMTMLRGKRNRGGEDESLLDQAAPKKVECAPLSVFSRLECWEQAQQDLGDAVPSAAPTAEQVEAFRNKLTQLGQGEVPPPPQGEAGGAKQGKSNSSDSFATMVFSQAPGANNAAAGGVKTLLDDLVKLMSPQVQQPSPPSNTSAPKTVAAGPAAPSAGRGGMPPLPSPDRGGRGSGQQQGRGRGRGGRGAAGGVMPTPQQQGNQPIRQVAAQPIRPAAATRGKAIFQQPPTGPFATTPPPPPPVGGGGGLLATPQAAPPVSGAAAERQKRFQAQQQQQQQQPPQTQPAQAAPVVAAAPAASRGKRGGRGGARGGGRGAR